MKDFNQGKSSAFFITGICILAATSILSATVAVRAENSRHALQKPPRPDHVVIVLMENKSFSEIIGNPKAPYINLLAGQGALLAKSYGITHPSQPNYLALFSGSTQEVNDDSCPHTFTDPNLGSELIAAGLSFATFSESIPSVGYTGCVAGRYYRKHNPAVNWQGANISPASNRPFTDFPSDYNRLPAVSLVIPNILNDMHDGTIERGDKWLRDNLDDYIRWARTHCSLLILTWDEGDSHWGFFRDNHIPTILVGEMVRPVVYTRHVDHYDVLRTILDMYGLPAIGNSNQARPLTNIWRSARHSAVAHAISPPQSRSWSTPSVARVANAFSHAFRFRQSTGLLARTFQSRIVLEQEAYPVPGAADVGVDRVQRHEKMGTRHDVMARWSPET